MKHAWHRLGRAGALGSAFALAGLALGCGGATTFQGKENIAIVGIPPAPPPPPPAPPPPPPPPPPAPPKRVELTDKAILIKDKIHFDDGKATIKPESHALLDELVEVIKSHPALRKIAIEGYASKDGPAALNLKLSDDRAKSVLKYFVDHGVEAKRLTAKGFGETHLIADNKTEEGREKNRRVEFKIVEVEGKKVEAKKAKGGKL